LEAANDPVKMASLSDEEALLFRMMQGGEYLEFDVTEADMEKVIEWYGQHQADVTLLSLMLKGEIFWAGFDEDGENRFTLSPQGRSRFQDDELPQL
jgi:hypothetical protein